MNLPNALSFLRLPLAFAFLSHHVFFRAIAIFIAMATDFFDGYLARRLNLCTRAGTSIDPLCDKFFVVFGITTFFLEGKLEAWHIFCLLGRDIALIIFSLYLLLQSLWTKYQFRAIWSGKIATTFQFFILLALTFTYPIPEEIYYFLGFLGLTSLIELLLSAHFPKQIV